MKSNWQTDSLGFLGRITKGKLTIQTDYFSVGFLPIVNTNYLRGDIKLWGNPEGAVISKKEDVLILWDGERSGLCAIGNEGIVGSTFARIRVNDTIDPNFLYYFLDRMYYWIQNQRTGTGVPHVPKDLEKILFINYPPLPQQQKIAQILSTCDAVIEKTEAAIGKYKAIKEGMMQDLFTRGIDTTTGRLRPKFSDAPHLYKESELGMIPKEWEVKRLEDIGELKNGLNKDKTAFGQGTLFVNISDAYHEEIKIGVLGRVLVSESEKDFYGLRKGDILFVRSSVKPEGVGYNTVFDKAEETIVYSGFMIRFRLTEQVKVLPRFANYYFRQHNFRRNILRIATVSANTNVNQEGVKKISMIIPPIAEQENIYTKIKLLDRRIACEEDTLNKYGLLKTGLMNDLLTGQIEVHI